MDYKEAKQALVELMEAHKITVTTQAIRQRSDRSMFERDYLQTHYAFEVTNGQTGYRGKYSKGCADVLDALRKGYRNSRGHRASLPLFGEDRDILKRVLSGESKPFPHYVETIRDQMFAIAPRLSPEPVNIVMSMLMDAMGSDVTFKEWCDDLGYSDDSISAKETWEACNDERRAMMALFGDDYDQACDLAQDC